MSSHALESIRIAPIDLSLERHATAAWTLLDEYARSEMGDGGPLPDRVRETLIDQLRKQSQYRGWIAWQGERPVGLLNAFVGFSTFEALPLLNVHDLAVTADRQGNGIGRQLLETALDWARQQGFGRVTLEVRSDNAPAKRLYHRLGFQTHVPAGETMEFLKCSLLVSEPETTS